MGAVDDIVTVLRGTFTTWWHAVTLRPNVMDVVHRPQALAIVVTLALLAAVAMMAGQAVVLVVNRLRGATLMLSLGVFLVSMVAAYTVLSVVLWLLERAFLTVDVPFRMVVLAVLVSVAPLLLSFLVVIPLLGPIIDRVLHAWSLLILWVIAAEAFQVHAWAAAGMVLAAWLVLLVLTTLLNRPLAKVRALLYRRLTGRELRPSSAHLLDQAGVLPVPLAPTEADG